MVIMIMLFVFLLAFAIFNIFAVVIKRQKYKVFLIMCFYITAVVDILASIGVILSSLTVSLCNIVNIGSTYVHSFSNLQIGIC